MKVQHRDWEVRRVWCFHRQPEPALFFFALQCFSSQFIFCSALHPQFPRASPLHQPLQSYQDTDICLSFLCLAEEAIASDFIYFSQQSFHCSSCWDDGLLLFFSCTNSSEMPVIIIAPAQLQLIPPMPSRPPHFSVPSKPLFLYSSGSTDPHDVSRLSPASSFVISLAYHILVTIVFFKTIFLLLFRLYQNYIISLFHFFLPNPPIYPSLVSFTFMNSFFH